MMNDPPEGLTEEQLALRARCNPRGDPDIDAYLFQEQVQNQVTQVDVWALILKGLGPDRITEDPAGE